VIVSSAMASRFWPGQNALGRRIRPVFPRTSNYWLPKSQDRWLTVVGIAADVRLDGISNAHLPQMYLSYAQYPTAILHVLVRTANEPSQLIRPIQAAVAAIDRDEAVFDAKTIEEVLDDSTTQAGLLTRLLAVFAVVAAALAALGIYGLTAWRASSRTREIGIRIALGARRAQVLRLVASQTVRAVVAGIGAGLLAAVPVGRLLRGSLVGVSSADPTTLFVVPVAMSFVAAAAAWLPARRASRVEPMETLRHE